MISIKRKNILFSTFLFYILFVNVSLATPLYSTFGPSDSYNNLTFNAVGTYLNTGQEFITGNKFSLDYNGHLGSIEAGFQYQYGTNELIIALMTDMGGMPDSIIESFYFTDVSSSGEIIYGSSQSNPYLSTGTPYWLIASAATDSLFLWAINDQDIYLPLYQTQQVFDNPLLLANAFRLNPTNPIPEPSTFILLGAGLAGLALMGIRRRKS